MSELATISQALLQNVDRVEERMLEHEQVPCPVRHHFGPGVYIREVFFPAGTIVMGHEHRSEQLNIFLKGKVEIVRDGGTEVLTAPMIFTAPKGRKIVKVLEDVVWLNVHATEERDVDKLEAKFVVKGKAFSEMQEPDRTEDREDYASALEELGLTEEVVQAQTKHDDQIPFQDVTVEVQVGPSAIHGRGLFASVDFRAGDVIAPARLAGYRTPAGRHTNHAKEPNAEVCVEGEVLFLKALREITGCRGGQVGEEITIDYRQSAALVRSLPCHG
jgi:hypothetical protein